VNCISPNLLQGMPGGFDGYCEPVGGEGTGWICFIANFATEHAGREWQSSQDWKGEGDTRATKRVGPLMQVLQLYTAQYPIGTVSERLSIYLSLIFGRFGI
jgi:dihydrodipicolinate synthase/N-acetylneuraminate lyase